jgi:hypothetical protein
MIEVNPNVGNGAFAAIETLRVHTPGDAGATSAELRNLHEPLMTLKVRVPFEGLRSNSLNGVFVLAEIVEVVIQAPDSGMVVADKWVLEIDPLRPLVTVTE